MMDQQKAIGLITGLIEEAGSVRQDRNKFDAWRRKCRTVLDRIFGDESSQSKDLMDVNFRFCGMSQLGDNRPHVLAFEAGLDKSKEMLRSYIWEIEQFGLTEQPPQTSAIASALESPKAGLPMSQPPLSHAINDKAADRSSDVPIRQDDHAMYRRIGMMIGSPGDTKEERQVVTDVIARWNATHSGKRRILLEAVKWETHATPGLQGRPQQMINQELLDKSDCLIAVFRCRAGTPTGVELSGTIEEIRQFVALTKYVALYFYSGDVAVSAVDPDQLRTLREFQTEMRHKGLTAEYGSSDDLASKLGFHLTAIVDKIVPGSNATTNSETIASTQPPSLPPASVPPSVQQASDFFNCIKGNWHLTYERGTEDLTIDGTGNYFVRTTQRGKTVTQAARPAFRLRLLACDQSLQNVEISKDELNGKVRQIEVLKVSEKELVGFAKHDRHKLHYKRSS